MSEKATLLTSIPPVRKQEAKDSSSPLLSSIPADPRIDPKETEEKVPLLSQKPETESLVKQPANIPTAKPEIVKPTVIQSAELESVESVESVASESVVVEPTSITAFQLMTYASFVLNFLLAGAAAVILFKKAAKLAEERFLISSKALAIAGVLIMLHGLFATDLYASHLNNAVSSAPLFVTMAVWILVGPIVGFITRNLLARKDKPNGKRAYIDAGICGGVFFLTACGVSSGIKTNAALLSLLVAGFLMIVFIARSFSAFKVAKARHQELNGTSDQILIYGLLLIPALMPLLAFAHVYGLSDGITLFLVNFFTFGFILVVGLAMVTAMNKLIPAAAHQKPAEAEAQAPQPAAVAAAAAVAESSEVPPAPEPSPAKKGAGNLDDPIVQFLNSEEGKAVKSKAPIKSAAKSQPLILPGRKPDKPSVTPPTKPDAASASRAPNAPSRLKAPAKPKKRL